MELTSLRAFLLSLPGATEDTPFGPEILVYRIAGKMFALVDWQAEPAHHQPQVRARAGVAAARDPPPG